MVQAPPGAKGIAKKLILPSFVPDREAIQQLPVEAPVGHLAIHQVSEILPVHGVELVGPLPEGIQNYTTYAAGVSPKSRFAGAARTLLQTLTSPEAADVMRAKGMTPAP